MAATATVAYGTPRMSAIRKAPAPMTGGTISPPVLFIASTPAATVARKPVAFIRGMLITPSTITLAAEEPLAVPNNALVRIETLAGPPRRPPAPPKHRARQDRALGGPAAAAAGHAERGLHDELADVGRLEEGAEQDEEIDVPGGDLDGDGAHPLVLERNR